jgi:hypothetical protein
MYDIARRRAFISLRGGAAACGACAGAWEDVRLRERLARILVDTDDTKIMEKQHRHDTEGM